MQQDSLSQLPIDFQSDYDKKIRELRVVKKEMSIIAKENQKLQSDLKIKNETIASILDQNFAELKSLQEKNEKIIASTTTIYSNNIQEIEEKYKIFRNSFNNKLREYVQTHNKISGERIILLSNHNTELAEKMQGLLLELEDKNSLLKTLDSESNSKIVELSSQNLDQQQKYCILETKYLELEKIKLFLEKQNSEIMSQYDKHLDVKNHYENIINGLNIENVNLKQSTQSLNEQVQKNDDTIRYLSTEVDGSKKLQQDLHNKYLLVLNDNMLKQTSIDEKTMEVISLTSKISELECKTNLYETDKKEINCKITDFTTQIGNLQADLLVSQKMVAQLKIEKDHIMDEKDIYSKETEQLRNKLKEFELDILDRINKIQDEVSKEKEKYTRENDFKFNKLQADYEKHIMTIKNECNTLVADKDKQIDGLTSHVKSFTDNQYITLNELEKLKLANEKLKSDHSMVDQKITDILMRNKLEIDELRSNHKKEKDIIMESYNENIKKSQELNDALQQRLNQTMEALTLSKTAISNLKETNQNMEKHIYTRESDNNSFQDKYERLRSETLAIKEKLDRSIELNNNFSLKEKQYENQFKQLQAKYSQLLALTKRGISNMNS